MTKLLVNKLIGNKKRFLTLKVLRIVKKTFVFWSFVGMMLFVACTDITDLIGGDFVIEESNMHLSMDTVTIETYSILNDSVNTSISETHLLGSINDLFFGKVNAGIYAQFLINAGFDTLFHDAEFFDSLVFSLTYNGLLFGDTLTEHTIRIYEMEENIIDTFAYYSNQTVSYNPVEIASHTFVPKPTYKDSNDATGATTLVSSPIRINISTLASNPFANKLLQVRVEDYFDFLEESNSYVINHINFYEFFNGLYIATDELAGGTEGSMFGVNLYSDNTSLQLYKHDTLHGKTVTGNDTIYTVNRVSSLSVSELNGIAFNHFDHFDYFDADIAFQDQVINNDRELGEEHVYVQSLGGSHLRVKFPFIKNLNDLGSKIAVNKAELVLSVEDDLSPTMFEAPPQMSAQIQFGNDSTSFVPDISYGNDFFGGVLDTTANEYRFRITRYIQEVLDGANEGEDGLFIYSSPDNNAYYRVMLVGSDPSLPTPFSKRARLEITYTVID